MVCRLYLPPWPRLLGSLFFLWTVGTTNAAPALISPSQSVQAQPLVTLNVSGKRAALLVDTGSAVPLVLFPEALGGTNKATVPVELRAAKGGPALADSALILSSEIPGAAGILGWPILKNAIWKLDLPTSTHQFLTSLPEEARNWTSFPIVPGRDSLAIRHPQLGEVFIDSGARRGVCLSRNRWEDWKKAELPKSITLTEGLSPASPGGSFANPVAYDTSFRLPPLTLLHTNVGAAFFDSTHDGASILLGLEALSHVTLIVDGPGKRAYFRPSTGKSSYRAIPPNRLQCAFLPDPDRTNALYTRIIISGPGSAAGLQEGDRVISLNGSANPPSFQQMHDLVRKSGAKLTLGILRQRKPLQITLTIP